jgi:exodeoxyribonuclease V alpha subunit
MKDIFKVDYDNNNDIVQYLDIYTMKEYIEKVLGIKLSDEEIEHILHEDLLLNVFDKVIPKKEKDKEVEYSIKDKDIYEGMILYLQHYGLDEKELSRLRYQYKTLKKDNPFEYIIFNSIVKAELNNPIHILLRDRSIKFIIDIRDGIPDILLCWNLLTLLIKWNIPRQAIRNNLKSYKKLYTKFKNDKLKRLINGDPYIYKFSCMIPFNIIDKVFLSTISDNKNHPIRVYSCIKHFVKSNRLYYNSRKWIEVKLYDRYEIDRTNITKYFSNVKIVTIPNNRLDNMYVLKHYSDDENTIKMYINRMLQKTNTNIITKHDLKLEDKQLQGYTNGMTYPISILTGKPGTGKSTVLIEMIRCLIYNNIKWNTCCFTGSASTLLKNKLEMKLVNESTKLFEKRCSEVKIHKNISTIDSLILAIRNGKDDFRDDINVIIIDEFSMVSLKKFSKLIKELNRCHNHNKIILLGDPNQLPSIKMGNLLIDLIDYGKDKTDQVIIDDRTVNIKSIDKDNDNIIPHIELDKIYRTNNMDILNRLDNILLGKPDTLFKNSRHYKYIEDESLTYTYIDTILDDIDNVMILCSANKGEYGSNNINKYIDKKRNLLGGNHKFKIGDRIMCTDNGEYDTFNISNGDIFHVKEIKDNIYSIYRPCDTNKIITISRKHMKYFKLSYSTTIHKSQGKEYSNVLIILSKEYRILLNRNILYTAISRTTSRCTLISDKETLIYCINKQISRPITALPIKGYLFVY